MNLSVAQTCKQNIITKISNSTFFNTTSKLRRKRVIKDSGLKVNESKTEICLFHQNDTHKVTILLQNEIITSKKSMKLLGVLFNSKLNWSVHVSLSIRKSNRALCALRLIKHYLTPEIMRSLLLSNYYSIFTITQRSGWVRYFTMTQNNNYYLLRLMQLAHVCQFQIVAFPLS
jgi:hypothetical protein